MSLQVTTELLSAYLDRQLPEKVQRELEAHLAESAATRERLESLRRIVEDLKQIERASPPPTLEGRLARAIAREAERTSFLDRLEASFSVLGRQSTTFLMFTVVIALAIVIFLFAQALQQHERSKTRVIYAPPESIAVEGGERLEAAGRIFRRGDGLWIEEGLEGREPTRDVAGSSAEGLELRAAHAELEELWKLRDVFLLELDGEILRLETGGGGDPPDLVK